MQNNYSVWFQSAGRHYVARLYPRSFGQHKQK
jgi:hypothetical protein